MKKVGKEKTLRELSKLHTLSLKIEHSGIKGFHVEFLKFGILLVKGRLKKLSE